MDIRTYLQSHVLMEQPLKYGNVFVKGTSYDSTHAYTDFYVARARASRDLSGN